MRVFTTSSLFFLSSLCTVARCLRCIPAPGALPTLPDCRDLTNAIAYVSSLPGENILRTWGRRLVVTTDTMNLPKVYWLRGEGPIACAVIDQRTRRAATGWPVLIKGLITNAEADCLNLKKDNET